MPAPTFFARPVEHMDAGVGRGDLVGAFAGAVGRVIVHDQYVRGGHGGVNTGQQRLDIRDFVIGRNDD
jgi:hypothetical protein